MLTKGYPFTPIDAFSLLGKVILHELTHTTAGNVSEDVRLTTSRHAWPSITDKFGQVVLSHGAPIGFNGKAYGWKAALILAKEGGVNRETAIENADSLALFASGMPSR